jgi:anti-anti-sigma regulatory factor
MATIAVLQKVDSERLVENLNQTLSKLGEADGEVVLDFSSVLRVLPAAIQALEKLAARSEEKAAKIVLRGVNVDVYKVLKLARLSSRFTFVS